MVDDARQPLPDLTLPTAPSEAFDFFELLRRLESGEKLFGHAGRPEREPARLGQHVRLGFAARDIAEYQPGTSGQPDRVSVANIGLLGPEGPMPLHLTRWVLDRMSQRWFADGARRETSDTTFIDFANMLQHRMIALFYRAWADAHPEVQVERKAGGRVQSMLQALAGIGMPETRKSNDMLGVDSVRLHQAAAFAHQVEGPERLTLFLAEALQVPVRLKEFLPSWVAVPAALQTRIHGAYAALGRDAAIGPRSFQRQSRIELRIGPLSFEEFKALLPGGKRLEALKAAIRELVGSVLDVDLRIVLRRDEVPSARLGEASLARTAWLAPPSEGDDAEDMRLRTAVGWHSRSMEAAA